MFELVHTIIKKKIKATMKNIMLRIYIITLDYTVTCSTPLISLTILFFSSINTGSYLFPLIHFNLIFTYTLLSHIYLSQCDSHGSLHSFNLFAFMSFVLHLDSAVTSYLSVTHIAILFQSFNFILYSWYLWSLYIDIASSCFLFPVLLATFSS